MLILTGPPREVYHPLRIKDNAVHAGLSLPPVFWNHLPKLKVNLLVSLNNNLLTAQDHMETTDATEDGHHLLLTMLKTMVLPLKANTHTLPKQTHAANKEEISGSHLTHQPQDALDLPMPSTQSQSQLPLMPPIGANTHQVCSQIAQLPLTTLSFWSVSLEETGKSRTHGELDGENKAISDLVQETHAVSANMPVSIPTDLINNHLIDQHFLTLIKFFYKYYFIH